MPASYADILLGKLALEQNIAGGGQLRECLHALEAGQRAGVEQTLSQVLVKRGYLTRAAQRELEAARDHAERRRRAKLAVQLLIRYGRPGEGVLKAYYENLKEHGFFFDLPSALEKHGQITAQERAGLEAAIGRAVATLHQREAEELAGLIESPGRAPAAPPAGPPAGQPWAAAGSPAGQPWAAAGPPYPPRATAERQAYPWPRQPPAPPYAPPRQPAPAVIYGYPPPAPPVPGRRLTPPRPGPYAPGPPAPGAPGQPHYRPPEAWQPGPPPAGVRAPPPPPPPAAIPSQFSRTAERAAARMERLPDWARTGFRAVAPDLGSPPAAGARAAPEPEPPAAVEAAPAPRLKREALEEATGPVPGYEIQERIGKGTVGVVYRAIEGATGRTVALKVLLPVFMKNQTLVERFRREAEIAASLDHPNIRKIYTGGEAGGKLYLSMEYIDGETLQDKLDRQSVLPEAESLRWIAQIARAMDHYVKIGMLHRDVKPANVLVTRDNRALLCDLGISKRMYEDYALTMQGTTLGSPWYLSPEQGLGTDDLDIRSDIYSLGVTLFHCLTGRVPFLGGNAGVIISKHAREQIPDVRRLNPKLSRGAAALIERMMAKRREDRHQTPKELLAEIAWLRSESGIASTPIVPLDPPSVEEHMARRRTKPGFFRRLLRVFGLGG